MFTYTRMNILHDKMFAYCIVNREKDHFSYIHTYIINPCEYITQ